MNIAANRADPTRTKTLREREFRPALTRRFRALKSAIRATVGYEHDALRLAAQAHDSDDIPPRESFTFRTDAEAQDAFLQWVEEQTAEHVLERMVRRRVRNGEHYTAPYLRSAAQRGWEDAAARLRRQGVDVEAEDLELTFGRGVPQEQIQMAYTRTFEDLRGVTQDMQTGIRRELSRGLAEGWHPRKMARNINDRVEKIGITRAERIARTETIRNYNEFALTRYERAGVKEVGAKVEFNTAGDNRVCETCAALEGTAYTIDEARGVIPGGTHPQCRCAWVPVVT